MKFSDRCAFFQSVTLQTVVHKRLRNGLVDRLLSVGIVRHKVEVEQFAAIVHRHSLRVRNIDARV